MAPETNGQQGASTAQSLIRKLTTEKAVKAYCQQTKETAAKEDAIANIKLAGRGIKTIESLDLPNLRRLDLSKNSLNRLKGLQGCPQVTYLTAAGNELTGEGLDGVRPLRDLKVFNASSNRVRRIAPSVFAQFRQLQALVLNNNEISEVPPTWLKKGLLTLNTVVLSHNKVKSLADAGFGRLTVLTKLSISYNMLSELPDLSACSALEELRAAHNLVSSVPSSLGKNVALRTLDLGHNSIEGWDGLERVGKSLTSLVQLTLAGNPLCGNASAAGAQEAAPSANDGEGEGDEYVAKVRSLFPGLKVRDGKRILMKKSHTYYEQRAAEGEATSGASVTSTRRGSTPAESSRKPRSDNSAGVEVDGGQPKLGQKNKTKRRNGAGVSGDDDARAGKTDSGDAEEEERSKEKRRLKKAARKPREEASEGGAGVKRARKRAAVDTEHRVVPNEDVPAVEELKPKMKKPLLGDADGSKKIPAVPDNGKIVVEKKGKKAKKKPSSKDRDIVPDVSTFNSGDRDPYSSSEELPIPGVVAAKKIAGAGGREGTGVINKSIPGGDPKSGVVAVVLNKKRKGAKKGSKGKAWHGGATPQSNDVGEDREGGGGFRVEAMLQARGQRETVGLGSGVSAWD